MRHCGAAADGGRMAFTISGPSTKCSLCRKQSPATVRRMSRLRRYDPSPIMCRAWRWMAVRRAKVVGAALIHTSMPYSKTGRTKPRYTIARCFGSSTADALRRKPSRWTPRTASCRIWLRNASCLSWQRRASPISLLSDWRDASGTHCTRGGGQHQWSTPKE